MLSMDHCVDFYRIIDKALGAVLFRFFYLKKKFIKKDNFLKFKKPVEKILLIKLWGLGNLTVIYPLVHKIKERYPNAQVFFLTFDLNKDFLERNKSIDRVVYFRFTKNIFQIIFISILLLNRLRKENIDLVINFETFNNTSALFSYLIKPFMKIGINNKYEKIFYDYWVDNNPSLHISRIFASLLIPLGIDSSYAYSCFEESLKDKKIIENLLADLKIKKFICIHPGSSDNFKHKRWGLDGFVELSNMLLSDYNFSLVITGKENDLINNIIKKVYVKNRVYSLADPLNVWNFIELLRKSSLFISNDTGPLHIAASLGINTATFFGPTSPDKYAPLSKNSLVFYGNFGCSPCVGADYINNKCMDNFRCMDFSPKKVFKDISERFFNEKDRLSQN